jgi:uncharacterized membrane protein HdeD (DUF308 family)
MKILFYLAGGLLLLSGLLHLVQVFTTPYDPMTFLPTASNVIFGIAYMVVGAMLIRGMETALRFGVIVALIGGLLRLMTMGSASNQMNLFFLAVDAIVIACCIFLMRAGRPAISRVK